MRKDRVSGKANVAHSLPWSHAIASWKRFHYLVYVASVAVFAHSLLTDPHLKGQVDFLDGEKLLVAFCGALTLAFGIVGVKGKRSRSRERQGASIASRRMTENNRGAKYE